MAAGVFTLARAAVLTLAAWALIGLSFHAVVVGLAASGALAGAGAGTAGLVSTAGLFFATSPYTTSAAFCVSTGAFIGVFASGGGLDGPMDLLFAPEGPPPPALAGLARVLPVVVPVFNASPPYVVANRWPEPKK